MSGYYGYSMSNNAVMAYAGGEMPRSKWTKSAILEQVDIYLRAGLEMHVDRAALDKVPVARLRDLLLEKSSWHHTSSWYNATSFYMVSEERLESLTDADLNAPEPEKKETPKPERWVCEVLEWSGTKKHPKATVIEVEGEIRGNWLHLDDGTKKSVTARGFKKLRRV
jgi:hypothetical protein